MANDKAILDSWEKNVDAWTEAIRDRQIESRRLVTDQAIVEAICSEPLQSALDIGCGEGWLVRELSARGIAATGMDAIPAFVDAARRHGAGEYLCMSYEELAEHGLDQTFDLAVCNFSLLGESAVAEMIGKVPSLLNDGGRFIVQTLNPKLERNTDSYRDGWRPGSWQGFGPAFIDPSPWYFRTLETWHGLFARSGLKLLKTIEPCNPATGVAASIVFTTRVV